MSNQAIKELIGKTSNLSISNTEAVTALKKKIFNWASTTWIPESKIEEDSFLFEASKLINKNCTKNPGKLGEWAVIQKLKELKIDVKGKDCVSCPWLIGQSNIEPDVILDNYVIEVKTLRYYNSKGKRGNQGTGSEKIDSIFRKYSNVYSSTKKKPLVIFAADQMLEKNGVMYLEAFNNTNYNNNKMLEKVVPFYKDELKFNVIKFSDIKNDNKYIEV